MINTDNPFETFQNSAFRLEALPQYIVDDEKAAFIEFKKSSKIPEYNNYDWAKIVINNIKDGKTISRLRLLSHNLSEYEQFETQIYTGPKFGEKIRANYRDNYTDTYKYDFWLFDNKWISKITYEKDGTFVNLSTKEASDEELKYANYWIEIFKQSQTLVDFLHSQ